MKTKDIKKEEKRSISILTVFLWIALIAVMSFIVISGISKGNALEGETRKITIKVDFTKYFDGEGIIEEADKVNFMQNNYLIETYESADFMYYFPSSLYLYKGSYVGSEGNIGIYEVEIGKDAEYIGYHDISKFPYPIESKTNEIIYIYRTREDSVDEISTRNYINYGEKIKDEQDIYEVEIGDKIKSTKVNIDLSEISDYEYDYVILESQYSCIGYNEINKNENNVITFEVYIPENIGVNICIPCGYGYKVEENGNILEEISYFLRDGFNIMYSRNVEKGEKKEEYNFKIIVSTDTRPQISNDVKWIDKENKLAQIEFKYNSVPYYYGSLLNYDQEKYHTLYAPKVNGSPNYVIFVEKLSSDFLLAEEYKNNNEWKIIEKLTDNVINNEGCSSGCSSGCGSGCSNNRDIVYLENGEGYCTEKIPPEVIRSFFTNYDNYVSGSFIIRYTGIKYVYVKSTNTVYCLEDVIKSVGTKGFKVEYVGEEKDQIKVNNEIEVIGVGSWRYSAGIQFYEDYYILDNTYLKYRNSKIGKINVNKLINGKNENNTYYIGVFNDETSSKTDDVYSIDVVNGKGSKEIEINDYDENKNYYIYEVDKDGNKIESDELIYSKNKVLDGVVSMSQTSILSDNKIVSSVKTNTKNELGVGAGEEYYIDNAIKEDNIYEDIVTITTDYEEVHIVKYVAKEGGTLDGVSEEVVKHGETPKEVPNTIPNENYKFNEWIVIKDGEEVKVNPSTYVINEDTIFYAGFEKIPAKVIVKYIDERGNELLPKDIIDGKVGDEYTTERKRIKGYVASGNDPENKKGKMVEGVIEVIYVYKKTLMDTSDIDIGKYVAISIIAIAGAAIGILMIKISKKSLK